jgi:hypothetical protein
MNALPRTAARAWRACSAWLLGACTLTACSFTDPSMNCDDDRDCLSGYHCYKHFCALDNPDAGQGQAGRKGGGTSGSATAGREGTVSNPVQGDGSVPDAAVGGGTSSAGRASGAGRSGASAAGAAGSRDGAAGSSAANAGTGTAGTSASGAGSGGANAGTSAAQAGSGGVAGNTSTCQDGDTRDCTIDLMQSGPADACRMGTARCASGMFGACEPKVRPGAEVCNGQDDDCDGKTDEDANVSCYSGPSGTLKIGKCVAGTQTCTNGALSACVGAVLPTAESCANEGGDDNCDAMQDNIAMRGSSCQVTANMGACQSGTLQCQAGRPDLVCVTHAPSDESCNAQDDDCDGKVDETFNLQSDANNCGACGNACATGESCCGGRCANTQNDVNNCGGCARGCASGARPGCCSGSCVDLLGDDNCGSCGHACGLLGGVVCTCAMTSSGTSCTAPLGLCL